MKRLEEEVLPFGGRAAVGGTETQRECSGAFLAGDFQQSAGQLCREDADQGVHWPGRGV
jgi:hypothetical protein